MLRPACTAVHVERLQGSIAMIKPLQILRLATAVHRADPVSLERYENFQEYIRMKNAGNVLTERYIRETYDQWRRSVIENEVRASLRKIALLAILKDAQTRLVLLAMLLVILAVIFPPFQYSTSEQSVHLGFGFVFDRRAGTVNSWYLACELAGIAMLYLLARELVKGAAEQKTDSAP